MSHYKKLANETLIYGLGTIVPRFLNFIVLTPYFTRVMMQTTYGVYTEIYAYSYLLLVILTYGTETGYFKFSNDTGYDKKKVFNNIFTSLLISSLFFIVLLNIFIPKIYSFIQFGGQIIHLRLFSGIMFLEVMATIPFAKLRNEKKSIKFSIIKILNVAINLSLVTFFISKFYNNNINNDFCIYGLDKVGFVLLSNLLASGISLILLYKEVLEVKIKIEKKLLVEILLYSSPLLIAGISGALNETLDKILLRFLIENRNQGYELLGIYNANYKLAVVITLFIQMFRYAAEPFFFGIEKEKNSKKVYGNVLKYFLIFVLLIFIVVTLYIDIFKLYIGKDFRSGLYIVPIVLVANVLYGILININFWFKLSGLTKWAIYIVGFGAVITIMSNLILVPHINIAGCAWSHVLSYSAMIIMSFWLGRKYYKIEYDLKNILFYVILTCIIFVLGYYANIENVLIKYSYKTILVLIFIAIVNYKEKLFKSLINNEVTSKNS